MNKACLFKTLKNKLNYGDQNILLINYDTKYFQKFSKDSYLSWVSVTHT